MNTMIPWWKKAVIYQIYPRSFQDSDHDGVGDLEGIISRLEYLQDLGIDAIWLSPVNPSPMVDFGYDVSDYQDIDPLFGSLEIMDTLIAKAHTCGIKVIMDLVLNHSSDQHAWFLESRSGRDNPYRDWYIWADPGKGGKEPNNWVSLFGGKAWEYDKQTGQYYYHMFCPQQPDLNWRNPKVEEAVLNIFRFWMGRGVDGFRLDVFNEYFKDALLRDNPVTRPGLRSFDRQNHLYDADQPEMEQLVQRIRAVSDEYPDQYLVGETFLSSPEKAGKYTGNGKLHAAFNFDLLNCSWDAGCIGKALECGEKISGEDGWPTLVLNNHDNRRSASRYRDHDRDERNKAAAVLLLTARGTPFLYYGEEIGMRNVSIPYSKIQDPPGKRYFPFFPTRDGCRSPMQWDDTPFAGFSDAEPWLPVHPGYPARNVRQAEGSAGSLLQVYKRLLKLRKTHMALQVGDFTLLDNKRRDILCYSRTWEGQLYVILINFSHRSREVEEYRSESKEEWKVLFSSLTPESECNLELPLVLRANEAVILQRKLRLFQM